MFLYWSKLLNFFGGKGIVDMAQASVDNESMCDAEVVRCQTSLAQAYDPSPHNASSAFWEAVECVETPLETLVKYLRSADKRKDIQARTRILAAILERTRALNELWARKALGHVVAPEGERCSLQRARSGRRTFCTACALNAGMYIGPLCCVRAAGAIREGRRGCVSLA